MLISHPCDLSFTGQNQDTLAGFFDFMFREYAGNQQGRWISPDPAGMAAVNLINPQTWNRYAYVGNGPLGTTDPLGLWSDAVHNVHYSTYDPFAFVPGALSTIGGSWDLHYTDVSTTFNGVTSPGTQQFYWEFVQGPGSATFMDANSGSSNSSYGWNFAKAFVHGVIHGVRKDKESFGDCLLGNANETTFGAHGAALGEATLVAGAVGGILSTQAPASWSLGAGLSSYFPAGMTIPLGAGLATRAALTLGTQFNTALGAGVIANFSANALAVAGAAEGGLIVGSAINCR